MDTRLRRRRLFAVLLSAIFIVFGAVTIEVIPERLSSETVVQSSPALDALEQLAVKGRAPKTGYERAMFGDGWREQDGCDTRNIILNRDLRNVRIDDCVVLSGELNDPYTGQTITFTRGARSAQVQIDHVVALSDAWQTGAQQLSYASRIELANDPLNLLAVDGSANQQKSDADAASWLPANKVFRCEYVARQIAVKARYSLWVTESEKRAMRQVLARCPGQSVY